MTKVARETKTKITDALAKTTLPQAVRLEIKDTVETGFSLRIAPSGVRTFALKTRDAAGRYRTITLGRYPELTVKEARTRAQKARLDLKDGKDINAEKRRQRNSAKPEGHQVSLGELVLEFEGVFSTTKKSWAPRGPKTSRSNARGCVECVFHRLLGRPIGALDASDFATAMDSYAPARKSAVKKKSNGQVSRARAYLIPVLDWAAGRGAYGKAGAARKLVLTTPDLRQTFDPSQDDPTITGERDRVLDEEELAAILPLLTYPAPLSLGLLVPSGADFRPIAMRFLLMTGARREEVVGMRRRDIDLKNRVWRKPDVKSTKGGRRDQQLPITDAIAKVLTDLPHFGDLGPNDLVFPNSDGGRLGNWDRFNKAIHKASNTAGWHRHDLRRTAATLMRQLGVAPSVVDQILGHKNPFQAERVSGAAPKYMRLKKVLRHLPDNQVSGLEQLADALVLIESGEVAAA